MLKYVETATPTGSGLEPSLPGGVAPATNFMPFRHVHTN